MKNYLKYILLSLLIMFLTACGGEPKHIKSPIDIMIKEMGNEPVYDIVLYDLEDNSGLFSSDYKHQYKIIKEKDSLMINNAGEELVQKIPYTITTPWYKVSKSFFKSHADNMGMVIASKDSTGKISKIPAPLGYSRYVGNSRYGHWGGGTWHFFSNYLFMRAMFGGGMFYRNNYNTYNSSYRGRQAYYGKTTTGSPKYGTKSSAMQKRINSGTSKYRSGSRYRSSGSSRSRGGGFGK